MTSLNADRDLRQVSLPRIWSGYVGKVPASFDEKMKVVIPDLHPDLSFEEVRWDSTSTADPPNEGDAVLIVFDNNREPWVLAIWPPQTPGVTTAAPSGPAGGDLSGTYPNPVVARASGLFYLGTAGDTYLYRNSAGLVYVANNLATGAIQTSSWILAGSDLYMRSANPHIYFGPSDDTNLYRSAVGALQTDGSLTALKGLAIGNAAQTGWSIDSMFGDVGARQVLRLGVNTDTQPRFAAMAGGQLNWGQGGSTAVDTNLYRSAAGVLRTDGQLWLGSNMLAFGGYVAGNYGAASQVLIGNVLAGGQAAISFGSAADTNLYRSAAYTLRVSEVLEVNQSVKIGVSNNAFLNLLQNTAYIYFGVNSDTNLFRAAAGLLGTTGSVAIDRYVTIDNANAGNKLYFGSAADTNLYRSAANALKTDSNFLVGATISVAWNSALAIQLTGASGGITFGGDTNLYRSAVGVLKTDGSLIAGGFYRANSGGGANQIDIGLTFAGAVGSIITWGGDTNLYRYGAGLLMTDGGMYFNQGGGANKQVLINNDGGIYFGYPYDMVLYKSGGGVLQLNTAFNVGVSITAGTYVAAQASTATQVVMGARGPSGEAGLDFGSAADTKLYRSAANVLASEDKLVLLGNMQSPPVPLAPQARNGLELWLSSASLITLGETSAGNANPALTLYRTWAGGTSGQAARLALPSTARGFTLQYGSGNYGAETYTTVLEIDQNGKLLFGPEGSLDTNLYRAAADNLKTDDTLSALQVVIDPANAGYKFYLGGALDTYLYRYAANQIATNGDFYSSKLGWFIAGANAGYVIRSGQSVVTTAGAMDATVSFSPAFPNTCTMVVAMNGNISAAQFTPQLVSQSATGFVVRCIGLAVNQGVAINYIAMGF